MPVGMVKEESLACEGSSLSPTQAYIKYGHELATLTKYSSFVIYLRFSTAVNNGFIRCLYFDLSLCYLSVIPDVEWSFSSIISNPMIESEASIFMTRAELYMQLAMWREEASSDTWHKKLSIPWQTVYAYVRRWNQRSV